MDPGDASIDENTKIIENAELESIEKIVEVQKNESTDAGTLIDQSATNIDNQTLILRADNSVYTNVDIEDPNR